MPQSCRPLILSFPILLVHFLSNNPFIFRFPYISPSLSLVEPTRSRRDSQRCRVRRRCLQARARRRRRWRRKRGARRTEQPRAREHTRRWDVWDAANPDDASPVVQTTRPRTRREPFGRVTRAPWPDRTALGPQLDSGDGGDGGGREDGSRAREPDDSPARDRVTDAPVRRKRRLGRGEPLGSRLMSQHERLQGSTR